jgi:hypothetical protein
MTRVNSILPIFTNKEDAFNKAILKAQQGQSYAEICKYLQVKENYFHKDDRQKIELHEKSWLLSKARNNFENKRFNNALWGKYFEIRFSPMYNETSAMRKISAEEQQKLKQGDDWKELEEQIKEGD